MIRFEKLSIPLAVVVNGAKMILVDVQPWHPYENNKADKTSILGYKYTVAENGSYEKFTVKVSTPTPIITPEQLEAAKEPIFVAFKDCFAKPYRNQNGMYDLSFTAATVSIEK